MKILSIITVVKNRSEQIEATIKSVLSQKNDNVEYIVIDGKSTDGTTEIVKRYHDNIDITLSEYDSGIYDAINKGINLATGRYIGLLHAGDTMLPNVISRILEEISKSQNEVLYGCVKMIKPNGSFSVSGFSVEDLPNCMIPHPATFVPLEIYQKFGLYDTKYRIASDYDYFSKLYLAGVKFKFIDIIVCNFPLTGISSTNILTAKEALEIKIKYKFKKPEKRGIIFKIWNRIKRVIHALMD